MRSKKAIINIVSTLLLQIVTVICGFIVPRLILENFGSAANGLVASITQFLSYIALIDGGFGVVIKASLYRPLASNDEEKIANIIKTSQSIFKKISYILIGYIIILICIFPIINNEFSFGYTTSLIIILALGTFIEYYFGMTYRLYLQANQKLYIMSFIQILLYILNTIIVWLLINMKANLQVVKLVSSLIFIIKPIVQYIYIKRKYKIDTKKAIVDKTLISQRWNSMVQHVASIIHTNTDVVVLTIFSTLNEVSVYSVYSSVMAGLKNIITAISSGIEASFGDMIAKKEKEVLRNNFRLYEFIQYNIITIIFTVAAILILPFIRIYTNGINDTNYQRPLFAYLFVITQGITCIRLMYHSMVGTAGKFKETQTGSMIEVILNIVISLCLVKPFGIIGIMIGTLVSTLIRCIELIIYVSNNILERNVMVVFKNVLVLVLESTISIIFTNMFINMKVDTYFTWIIYAVILFVLTCIISDFKEFKIFIVKILKIVGFRK